MLDPVGGPLHRPFPQPVLPVAVGLDPLGAEDPLALAALAGLSCGVWKDLDELKRLRRSQRIFSPERPQADCDREYRTWKRAVQRAADWIEH